MSELQLNRLLQRLNGDDAAALLARMVSVDLTVGDQLVLAGDIVSYVYFPETCAASLLADTLAARPIEVGMIGYEGMSNMVMRVGDRSALTAIVHVAGRAWRVKAEEFAELLFKLPSFAETAFRYKEALAIQFAYTSLANGAFKIEARLARWFLMSHDRAQRDTLPVSHEFLARLLAVRRSGITTATHVLEGEGAISARRAEVRITNREKLRSIAGASYGVPEAEYEQVMAV